jgi:hypothetical protein
MPNQSPHYPCVDYTLPIPDSDEALCDEISRLAGHINAATYRFLKLLAVAVERESWGGAGGFKSAAHWLNYKCGIALGAAREKIRVAKSLDSLPQIDAAFKTGALSYSKVRAMTRVATPENEDYLLYIARYGTASHVEKLVQKFQYVSRLRNKDQARAQQDARSFSWHYDDDGMVVFHGKLPAESGRLVINAIEAAFEEVKNEAAELRQRERMEALYQRNREAESMLNSAEDEEWLPVCRAEYSTGRKDDGSNEEALCKNVPAETFFEDSSIDTYEQLRADALVFMAEQALQSPLNALSGGDKYQVVVHIDANSVDSGDPLSLSGRETHCYIEDGPFLAPETTRRLACDAGLVTVLEDSDGNVLNIGRRSRAVPSPTRRALNLRDQGCRFPGCTESRHVDAHHIEHWCDGGETSLDNLVLLCRHHHRLLHEGGYQLYVDDNEQLVFVNSLDQRIESAMYPQFADMHQENAMPLAIELENDQLGLGIDCKTGLTGWGGETLDYDVALEALWDRRGMDSEGDCPETSDR